MGILDFAALEEAMRTPADERTGLQRTTVGIAAQMQLEFLRAQRERLASVSPLPDAPVGSAEALAHAALHVVQTCLNDVEFVPRGKVEFAVTDLQVALYAYRGMNPPDGLTDAG